MKHRKVVSLMVFPFTYMLNVSCTNSCTTI